ncbi:papain-like cysteine protease family protein [Acanthopleuribacter pedis]|uniref:Peptidase C39-like domain-containing protein n=1 Tax=Acanthopleuribacter pedis TaxID=442870 RepID=A0A8J7QBF8_9BACT|nr:papain-like cysteine protease family protein [Acanthopleuribacter pedis]MBO1321372.1 hypothetical protein [Acanthopleuribacter pedis]
MPSRILAIPSANPGSFVPQIDRSSPFCWAATSTAVRAYYHVMEPVSNPEQWGRNLWAADPTSFQTTSDGVRVGNMTKALGNAFARELKRRVGDFNEHTFKGLITQELAAGKPVIAGLKKHGTRTGHAILLYGFNDDTVYYSCSAQGNKTATFNELYNNLAGKFYLTYLYLTKQPPFECFTPPSSPSSVCSNDSLFSCFPEDENGPTANEIPWYGNCAIM